MKRMYDATIQTTHPITPANQHPAMRSAIEQALLGWAIGADLVEETSPDVFLASIKFNGSEVSFRAVHAELASSGRGGSSGHPTPEVGTGTWTGIEINTAP